MEVADTRPLKHQVELRLGFWRRLSTRMIAMQAGILLVVVVFTSFRFQQAQLDEARQTLTAVGETLLPFMVPSVRPALDLAFDASTGKVDRDLIQLHIVKSAFAVAKKNTDLVYVNLVLPAGESVEHFVANGVNELRMEKIFAGLPPGVDRLMALEDVVAHQAAIFSPDSKTHLGTLRVVFSLARVGERARRTSLMTYAVGAALLLLALGVTATMGRTVIYGPLARLLDGAQRIARGELGNKPLRVPPGEFSQLAAAFLAMTDALRQLVQGVKDTSAGVQHAVQVTQKRAQNMLAGARRHVDAMNSISGSVAQLDGSGQKVENNVGVLKQAALAAAQSTQDLSSSLTDLEPEVNEFGQFVSETDVAVKNMAQRALDISQLVDSMAESTGSTATTVQEFDHAIQMIGTHASTASHVSASVMQTAAAGQNAVKESIDGMRQIDTAFGAIAQAVKRLGESMTAIGQIVRAINAISDQTKLLSLNASILAAQAGEHGAGFSVVADEIKALSERTMAATREIQGLITRLDDDQRTTVAVMTQGLDSVRRGSELAKQAGNSIEVILKQTGDSHTQMQQIATATGEQVAGSKFIAEATQKMAELGKQILAAAEEQTAAAQTITSMSAKVVASSHHMQATLSQQAARGLRVAEGIGSIAQKAGELAAESAAQRTSRAGIVTHVAELKDFADAIVNEAERVASEVESLNSRTEQVRDSIEHFRLE